MTTESEQPPAGQSQAAATTEPPVAPSAQPPATETPPPPWAIGRIDTLTRQRREMEEERDRLTAELARVRAAATAPPASQTPAPAQLPLEDQVNLRAQQIAAEQTFRQQTLELDRRGAQEFPDWNQKIAAFQPLGGISRSAVEAALELDAPHKVLHALSGDLNEAARIFSLPPIRQATALAQYAAKLEAKPVPPPARPVSSAPAPVTPVVGGGAKGETDLGDPAISMAEFARLRAAQVKARRGW